MINNNTEVPYAACSKTIRCGPNAVMNRIARRGTGRKSGRRVDSASQNGSEVNPESASLFRTGLSGTGV